MLKKFFTMILIVAAGLQIAGCASVQKKFTRKKKVPDYTPAVVYTEEGPYQKKFSNEYYYKKHFTLWRSWHGELLNYLGANQKKVVRCAQESLGHLNEMHAYLLPEKQAELDPQIEDLSTIMRRLESGTASPGEQAVMRTDLERIERIVSGNFYYNKVQDFIIPETVDLGGDEAAGP